MKRKLKSIWAFYVHLPFMVKGCIITGMGILMFEGQSHWASLWMKIFAHLSNQTVLEAYPPDATMTQVGVLAPLIAAAAFLVVLVGNSFPEFKEVEKD